MLKSIYRSIFKRQTVKAGEIFVFDDNFEKIILSKNNHMKSK